MNYFSLTANEMCSVTGHWIGVENGASESAVNECIINYPAAVARATRVFAAWPPPPESRRGISFPKPADLSVLVDHGEATMDEMSSLIVYFLSALQFLRLVF